MADDKSLYGGTADPADGIDEGFDVGGSSNPAAPSVHPDVNVYGEGSGDTPVGNADCEAFAGQAATPGLNQVQLATGIPEEYSDAGLGETLVGGLGDPPRV